MVEETTDKTLIISPHLDDEVYGCSSYLKDGADRTLVVYVTASHPLFPDGDNIEEQKKVAETAGFSSRFMKPYWDAANRLDAFPQGDLIDEFQRIVDKYEPDIVLLPAPSYNQDHRAVYDAALTAMRPHDRIHFVKRILLYEQPGTFGTLRKPDAFRPTYFRPVDIAFKNQLMHIYHSQLRGHRTPDHVQAIAVVRGMQADMPYAEAFEVMRWIE